MMYELSLRHSLLSSEKDELRCTNDLSRHYGLSLTETDINELTQLHDQALRSTGRLEFGSGILPKLVRAFCKSPWIDPQSYASTLAELQDAFYYFKNECDDRFTDDDLIEFMEKVFNGQAHGSTEVLTTISLEELCRWARNDFDDRYADEEAFW